MYYATFDQALSLVARLRKDSLLSKLDIKHAFQLCPVCSEDCKLLGIHWQGNFYIDLRLLFGLRSSPFLFNRLADAFQWLLNTNFHIQDLMHYLRPALTMFKPLLTWPLKWASLPSDKLHELLVQLQS